MIPRSFSATLPRQRTSTSDDASLMWSPNRKQEVPSLFFVHSTLMALVDVGLHSGTVCETSNCKVNTAGAGIWRHPSIMDSPFFLIASTMSTLGLLFLVPLLALAGRIALVGLVGSPLRMRVACPFNSPFISYASYGNGVKDDLLWTDKSMSIHQMIIMESATHDTVASRLRMD